MEKIGMVKIQKNRNGGKPARCANCSGDGAYDVTFQDYWGKLIVTLCEDCATKQYEELELQTRLNWPSIA
jgi:excinuclease UvrABC ATPase subunit